jgi:hypothetical protein
MILPPLTALFLGTQMVVTVADEVPKLDITATCRAESAQAPANTQACLKDEQSAHDQLLQQWATFASSDRVDCSRTTESGGSSSYVELLTCLQLARDARKLPRN